MSAQRVSAPGKLVLSGAYAVLRGAPSLVTAVDRRVEVDASRDASFETPEVAAALRMWGGPSRHPWFDASALRKGENKLGLGSSAAICSASIAALWIERNGAPASSDRKRWIAEEVYPLALAAHRKAQGGGSGVDVAAACFGGVFVARLSQPSANLLVEPLSLPAGLVVETWACAKVAKTSDFVRRVFAAEQSHPDAFAELFSRQVSASERAAESAQRAERAAFIAALGEQVAALGELGKLSDTPVVLPEVAELHSHEEKESAFLPSGAGGGDVTLYFGSEPSSPQFRRRAQALGFFPVHLAIDAPGISLD